MKGFWKYLNHRKWTLVCVFSCASLLLISFQLYHLPLEATRYSVGLCMIICMGFFLYDYLKNQRQHTELSQMKKFPPELLEDFPEPLAEVEADYQEIIGSMQEKMRALITENNQRYQDMVDYYTVWVHQIKTPISAMNLILQNEDTSVGRILSVELSKVERYVDMVMTYLRLEESETDYVFGVHDLDKLIQKSVRRFSTEFISRKIGLDYVPVRKQMITDEKWLAFVIEQLLSNALKYTMEGYIRIYLKDEQCMCIEDTGIGIGTEDLPRVFEKGYTGCNGRSDQKASGIGLFICKRICDNLGIGLTIQSEIGVGTIACLKFPPEKIIE